MHAKNGQFEDKRTNFNNDKLASINYINNYKNNWKLKFVTIFNDIENNNFVNSLYRFNFQGLDFTNIESKTWKQSNQNVIAKLEVIKDIRKDASLQFYNKLSWLNEDNDNSFIFNNDLNQQAGENKLFASENKLVYTKKLDSTQAVVAVGKFMHQNRPYQFRDQNNVFQFILNDPNAAFINQKVHSTLNFGGAKVSYLNNYSKDKTLEIQVGNEYRKDDLNSGLSVFDANNQEINFDKSPFQNTINYSENKVFSQANFNKNTDSWSYGLGLIGEFLFTNLNNDKKNLFIISPNFTLGYQNRRLGNINLNAARIFNQTGVENFYNNYIYQGNRNFRQTAIGFQNLATTSAGISYTLGDDFTRKISFSINYSKQEDALSNNTIVNPNYSFNQTILVKNNDNISANIEARRYFKFIKSRISLLGNFMQSKVVF